MTVIVVVMMFLISTSVVVFVFLDEEERADILRFFQNANLDNINYTIETDNETYQYGDIMKIDLVIENHGASKSKIYFEGYGGDKYELSIRTPEAEYGGVYTPTTNALSMDSKSSISLGPNEKKVFHHEWNLFSYSAGGCTGPSYGNIVEPGQYEIVSNLNLDADYYDVDSLVDRKLVTIEDLTFSEKDSNISMKSTSSPGYEPKIIANRTDNIVTIEYTPSYKITSNNITKLFPDVQITFSPNGENYSNPSIRLFENGFLHIFLYINRTSEDWDYEKEKEYRTITFTFSLDEDIEMITMGLFDPTKSYGWGSPPVTFVTF